MCGIFGFITLNHSGPDMGKLRTIATKTEVRGRDAFGFAFLRPNGRISSFKSTGPISAPHSLDKLNSAEEALAIIGHTRLATHGHEWSNINNHPHRISDGYFVHNGVVFNYDNIEKKYELHMSSDCDSEVIGLTVEKLQGPIIKCFAQVLEMCFGPQTLAALFNHPRMVILARKSEQSLHIHRAKEGIYFASDGTALPDKNTPFPNNTVVKYKIENNGRKLTSQDCKISISQDDYANRRGGWYSTKYHREIELFDDWEGYRARTILDPSLPTAYALPPAHTTWIRTEDGGIIPVATPEQEKPGKKSIILLPERKKPHNLP